MLLKETIVGERGQRGIMSLLAAKSSGLRHSIGTVGSQCSMMNEETLVFTPASSKYHHDEETLFNLSSHPW